MKIICFTSQLASATKSPKQNSGNGCLIEKSTNICYSDWRHQCTSHLMEQWHHSPELIVEVITLRTYSLILHLCYSTMVAIFSNSSTKIDYVNRYWLYLFVRQIWGLLPTRWVHWFGPSTDKNPNILCIRKTHRAEVHKQENPTGDIEEFLLIIDVQI